MSATAPLSSSSSSSSFSSSTSSPSAPLIGSVIKSQHVDLEVRCDECGSTEVMEDHRAGVLVCTNCGLQLGGQLISEEHEWREFDDDGPRSHGTQVNRVGGPEDGLLFMGLSTVMGSSADGNNALARLQSKSTTLLNQKALLDAFRRMTRIAAALTLPPAIVERAMEIYSKVMEAAIFKTQKGDSVLTACLFIACKQERVPRQLKEICQMAAAEAGSTGGRNKDAERDVARAYKRIKQHRSVMARRREGAAAAATDSTTTADGEPLSGFASSAGASASSLVERYCSTLRLPLKVEQAVRAVIENAEKASVLDGKTPATIAGAAIFLVSQLADTAGAIGPSGKPVSYTRTWEQIALVTLSAVSTLKRAYKSLHAERMTIVPQSLASPLKVSQLPAS